MNIVSEVNLDLQQGGLDFWQGGLSFLQDGLDLWQGGLDLQQVEKIFTGSWKNVRPFICVKCSKLAWFNFYISLL